MARAIKLINAPVGLFDIDGVLVLKTEYSTQHEDGAITPDCYIVDSGEYFWGGVDSVEERNNLMVTPIDMPTLTPPNEMEYRGYTCKNCWHTWLEDRDASDYPEYCPGCGVPLHKEENEPLTLEQLREMDGEPVYLIVKDGYEPLEMWVLIDVPEKDHIVLINNIGGRSAYYSDDDLERDHITGYRCPPEGEEDT